MFTSKTSSRVFVFVIIFSAGFENGSRGSNVTGKTPDEAVIEYSDYVEVPNLKKQRLDYYSFVDVQNDTKLVINKCCGREFYFDLDSFACELFPRNRTQPDIFVEQIDREQNRSRYLFVENIPDCGNESVISARVTSKVSIGASGAVLEGDGVFPNYCVDGNPRHPLEAVVLTCRSSVEFCRTRTCFRKCCPLGHSYGFLGRKCQKTNKPFKPVFYNLSTLARVNIVKFGIFLGDACGPTGKYLLERDLGEVSYLGHDGTLFAPSFDKRTFSENEFCLEFVETRNTSGMESFLCFSKTGTHFENSQLQFFLLSLGFIISCMFLLLTFLVYLFSPRSQNLYGKTLMCYIACLFSAYLCLAIIELKSKEIDKSVCTNLGYSLLFSFLAAFFWLNVMSFDIWKTFRLDRSVERSKADERKLRFLWYSLYAWSFPSAITAYCAYVNQLQTFPFPVIKPDIGEENCWFSKKKKGIYVFFIAPISLVITFNIIFYVQTAWKIWKVKSDVKKMEKQKTKRFSANKEQFVINGKLFIVMGITWSLEIISFFAPHPIWYITDAANALHGVFIFAVFVLKKKVLHQVSQQVRAPLKRMRQLTTSNSDDLSTRKNFQDLNAEGKADESGDSKN